MSWNAAAQRFVDEIAERLETDLTDEGRALIELLLPRRLRTGCQRTAPPAVSAR